jgi:opacity protein-like surface antigen
LLPEWYSLRYSQPQGCDYGLVSFQVGRGSFRISRRLRRFELILIFLWDWVMKMFGARSRGVQARKKGTLTVPNRRTSRILSAVAVAVMCSAASSAFAQNCTSTQTGAAALNLQNLALPAGAAGAAIAGAIGNVNTAFLTQQGSAFVSAPPNPVPDQPGGGVWARAVGGQVNVNSTSNSTAVVTTASAGVINNTATTCNNSQHESFAGVQVGADIARLNWNGWNVHLGTTAGYLGAKSNDNNGFSDTFQVPFLGTYLVATKGRFFADLMVREEFYNVNVNNTPLNYFNQPVGAHGYSISTSAGYNFDVGKGWFIEPSAGFIYSNTSVDTFNNAAPLPVAIPGSISTNNVISELGRASVRVGKTIETPNIIWQPFGSASVFHEFAGNVVTNYTSLPNSGIITGPVPPGGAATFTQQTVTSRIGTYGQYSLGLAAQVVNSGWLGFVRVDYRDGSNINGWAGNAGLRYQFTPEMIASAMPTKALKAPTAFIAPTNWTGFYIGGFAGVADGRSGIGFVGADPTTSGAKPWVFGALGGLELGYNRQFSNNWVIGVEGDVGGANIHGGGTAGSSDGMNPLILPAGTFNGQSFSPALFTIQDKTNWMATATARVGYAYGRTLYYVKGGAAFEDSSLSAACIYGPTGASGGSIACLTPGRVNPPAGPITGVGGFSTPSLTRVGWTLGFGTEFDLGRNWSAKTEYDYISFGQKQTGLASDGTTILSNNSSYISQVKVGVNYKFGPSSTVVAKY